MQFITNGPDIPEALLEAQEEGRVVFFCGAGISHPAGLPDFKGLVDEIYKRLGTACTKIEGAAYGRNQFDMTLDLLERRIPGQRIAVRKALADALQPGLRRRGATDTHTALLQLARRRDGTRQLVTTNFDRIFERAAKRSKQRYRAYAAPTLPVPKANRWNGLVHLHGLLPLRPDDSALNDLVVTSGDFGRAYLTERWAARFISELFRNHVVCFVGYGINDPVLRYMMDALAVDRRLGEAMPQAYALGGCDPDQEKTRATEWKSKGVSPILYEVHPGRNGHSALHRTLKVWAETHRDGVFGKERIVVQHALAQPSASTQQDDFVGRVLWALSDQSGYPAKRFAKLDPAPPLEWLMAFSERRFRYADLSRFGISPRTPVDADLRFSLVRRPAPYQYASWMALFGSKHDAAWDDVMHHIAHWLTRHLNNPLLIHWLVENGCQLHDQFSRVIEARLDRYDRLQREGKDDELNEIRAHSPHAIPDKIMRMLWRLLLRGRVKSLQSNLDFHGWMDQLRHNGLSASLRMQLREIFSPMIALSKPFRWHDEAAEPGASNGLEKIVRTELVLAADYVQSAVRDQAGEQHWQRALPKLLGDLQQLLCDALDLWRELGKADEHRDGSFWDLPSIEPHWQNRGYLDWVALIELLRDAWLAVRRDDLAKATRTATDWFELPYPTFKRLAFFAASRENRIASALWSDWLLSDARRWLWSEETQREVMRLLALQGHQLSPSQGAALEAAILDGPPRHMYQESLEPDRWEKIVESSVWLLLAKLDKSGWDMGETARSRFDALSSANPSRQLLPHQREEFPRWLSGTGDPDYEENREIDIAPRKRLDLVQWLRTHPSQYPLKEDTWCDACRTRFTDCLDALSDLAKERTWPADRWQEALQVWSEENLVQQSWRDAAPVVRDMPDATLQEIARGVAWWLEATSKSARGHEEILLDLCQRILNLPLEPDSGMIKTWNGKPIQSPVTDAINHPVGLVTKSLLNLWFRRKPNDNDRLPADIEPLFTQMCETQEERFRHGKVLLASKLVALFRVDRPWTEQHLLPFFRWADNPAEAPMVWEGFLWSWRIYKPLLAAFKPQLLETASYYNNLCEHGRQYAMLLTYAALERLDGDDPDSYRSAFRVLPPDGLQEAARTLSQVLESAGEQRKDCWTHRIRPFWKNLWPQSLDLLSDGIPESLALMSLSAGEKFPDAVDLIHNWLRPVEYPHRVVSQLQDNGFCARFPDAALRVLDAVIGNQPWKPSELGQCLTAMSQALPEMQNDPRYQRLKEYAA